MEPRCRQGGGLRTPARRTDVFAEISIANASKWRLLKARVRGCEAVAARDTVWVRATCRYEAQTTQRMQIRIRRRILHCSLGRQCPNSNMPTRKICTSAKCIPFSWILRSQTCSNFGVWWSRRALKHMCRQPDIETGTLRSQRR